MQRSVNTRAAVALAAIVLVGGCAAPGTHESARQDAQKRWDGARARIKARLAADHLEAGAFNDAAAELAEASRLDPNPGAYLPLQVRLLLALGDVDEARAALERAETAQPNPEIDYLRGIVCQQQQRWDDALACYLAAVEQRPADQSYTIAAAQAWLQLGAAEEALQLLEAQQARNGWTVGCQAAMAECREQLGEWRAAADAWQRVADAKGEDRDVTERLALARFRAGDFAAALPLARWLCRDEAAAAPADRMLLVDCLTELGELNEARGAAMRAMEHDGGRAPALLRLARIYAAGGDVQMALRTAQQALSAQPDDPMSLELSAALALRCGERATATALARRLRSVSRDGVNALADRILGDSATGPTASDAATGKEKEAPPDASLETSGAGRR